ncbi:DNA topoisomerase IV subunit A [Bacteroidia bacterium]|nr:DNA topoisomerase IV subunit A [Bacteroidia bacterium]
MDETKDNNDELAEEQSVEEHTGTNVEAGDEVNQEQEDRQEDGSLRSIKHLSGMFETWFLDYASYVILERAIPYVNDGLKPVQRRVLHAMKQLDDGRYNKVANIIGYTMQYHPHGDASIGGALVQLGQKDLLIDCQGNWGNTLTGDGAAAPRYIEARLSKFALEVVFNPKTTNWQSSYDGRNKEPVTLPVKFPLLLAQGVEGIAVGLAAKILPHNFNELLDACIAHLKNEPFVLYPDFETGGYIDVAKYNDGLRGGAVKIRAKIEKDNSGKMLKITEIPFSCTTVTLIESILRANDKGKIKIKKIDDNTAAEVEILVHLVPGISSDKTIDALYAFTDCELSLSPNSCVIENDKPCFMPVSEILKQSVNDTVTLLKLELEIRLDELEADWHLSSLERIFIEERIYKDKEFEESKNMEVVVAHVHKRLSVFLPKLHQPITDENVKALLEIKMKRILKFSAEESDRYITALEKEMVQVKNNIEHIIPYTIKYYKNIKDKHGKGRERRTEIRSFENIEAVKVVVANEKLYINREEGFIGTGLKKDEYVCDCSDIDDVIIFLKDGTYYITKVAEKLSVGQNVLHVDVFKKNDTRTIYNMVYRDGKYGVYYVKRFPVVGMTRDKQYDATKGTTGSKVLYFSSNPNGEAEVIKVFLRQKAGMKKSVFDYNFAELTIKGRASQGNQLTKHDIVKITLMQKGVSTLGGRKIWFDKDVLRLNTDGRGEYLGEFQGSDRILVVNKNGSFRTTNFDLENHYEDNYLLLEKFNAHKIWSAAFFDAEQGFYYLKRFRFEESARVSSFIGETEGSFLATLSCEKHPRFEIVFGGKQETRPIEVIDVESFIAEKSYKAHGKRLTAFTVSKVNEIEPIASADGDDNATDDSHANSDVGANNEGEVNDGIRFEITNPSLLEGGELKLGEETKDA